jgi:lipopolysaccharide export system protein LptA
MKINFNISRLNQIISFFIKILIAYFIFFCLQEFEVLAQSSQPREIRLKYADSLVGSNTPGIAYRDFFGNVQLEHGDVDVRSDFAKQYIELNNADLIGNVIITQGTLTLKSPKIYYYGNSSLSKAVNGVTIKDVETFLKAHEGTYNTKSRVAEFENNVYIEDDSAKIISDYIIHQRNNRKSDAFGNVWVVGKFTNAILRCDTLYNFPDENYSIATGNPLLLQIDSSYTKADTTFYSSDSLVISKPYLYFDTLSVRADTMHAYRELYNERYVFVGNVEIIRGEIRAMAKEAAFHKDGDYLVLSGKPVVWYDSTQLYGDSIIIKMSQKQLKSIESFGEAIAVSRNDTLSHKRLDQIMGDKIQIDIDSSKVIGITSIGEAKSLYFFRNEEGESGADRRTTDTIKVNFDEGEIDNIIWLGMTYAEFFPETFVYGKEETYYLPLFKWNDKKPESKKINFPSDRFLIDKKKF